MIEQQAPKHGKLNLEVYKYEVVDDAGHVPTSLLQEYTTCGYNWDKEKYESLDRHPTHVAELFCTRLWPGGQEDWDRQIKAVNKRIAEINSGDERQTTIQHMSEREYWCCIAIHLVSYLSGFGGHHLWPTREVLQKSNDYFFPPNTVVRDVTGMTERRHNELRLRLNAAFDSGADPEDDPYHFIRMMFDLINKDRAANLAASHIKVIDESMSPFQPRTTKNANLPVVVYLPRKPKEFGTEIKGIC